MGRCGQLKGKRFCAREQFHEGNHRAEDATEWGLDESDDPITLDAVLREMNIESVYAEAKRRLASGATLEEVQQWIVAEMNAATERLIEKQAGQRPA